MRYVLEVRIQVIDPIVTLQVLYDIITGLITIWICI